MSDYLKMAREAAKLAKKGLTNPQIRARLGLPYSKDVVRAVQIAHRQARIDDCMLTKRELETIMALARTERSANLRGDNSAFNGKWLGGAGYRAGQCLQIIRKRLGHARKGEPCESYYDLQWRCTGIGLVNHWHGGGVKLTRAGWALVHALEAAGVEGAQP